MARATERPPKVDQEPDDVWEHLGGESPGSGTAQALRLAHRASEKFPELAQRYRNFAGPAAIASGALVVLAGVAVARRMRKGQKAEEILEQITSEEIEQAATVSSRQNRGWRLLAQVARRRRRNREAAS